MPSRTYKIWSRQAAETGELMEKKTKTGGTDHEPSHSSCYKIKATVAWLDRNQEKKAHRSFLVDTGRTGPILNKAKIQEMSIPIHRRKNPIEIYDASGVPSRELHGTTPDHPIRPSGNMKRFNRGKLDRFQQTY